MTIEHLGPCKKLLRVEIDAEATQAKADAVLKEFQRKARIPGFRPGKTPRALLLKTFAEEINAEIKRKIISDAYHEAVEQHKLRPITRPEIEETPWELGQPFAFTATVETEADFEVPDYRGLPIRRDNRTVTDEDLERALRMLREQKPVFVDLDRPVQPGDFVVVNYTGTCEGKPITDIAPTARGLTEQKNFWLQIQTGSFIPGFTDPLVGSSAGETRTVTITFPEDFVTRELVGKQAVYQVEIVQVKERQIPELDDAFARSYGAENLEALRAGVRQDLELELKEKQQRQIRDQLVATLLGRVSFDLPESLVENETRNVVFDIVKANQERGVAKEAIDERKDEIYSVANNSAKERVKAILLLNRIAEKEGITATSQELTQRVLELAARYQIKPDKLVKQLQERGALPQIQRQIIEAKVLNALELYANIEDGSA
ncbi:MAG TPA: trigger factor [Candidatus Paceibacterota bacterium]|nr:trigger factor [Candidatus Paceibacterota bacterium]